MTSYEIADENVKERMFRAVEATGAEGLHVSAVVTVEFTAMDEELKRVCAELDLMTERWNAAGRVLTLAQEETKVLREENETLRADKTALVNILRTDKATFAAISEVIR